MSPLQTTAWMLALAMVVSSQVIEQRSTVRNPDGSMSHNTQSSYSHATFSEESADPAGAKGRTVHRDSSGRTYGTEWYTDKDGKMVKKNIEGGKIPDGVSSRTGGLGGFGAGFPNIGSGSGLGSGLGSGVGSGFGNPGFGSGFGSGFVPWKNFGDFGQFGFGQGMPQFDFSKMGFQQPLMIPNYSNFLLGGVGHNPNIAAGGSFGNLGFGLNNPGFGNVGGFGSPGFGGVGAPGFGGVGTPGFGGAGSGFGAGSPGYAGAGFGGPGYGQRSYKHEVDPHTGKQTYSYSESSGHSTSSSSAL